MDQIVKIKRLIDYLRNKPCPQATLIYWDNISGAIYEKLIKKKPSIVLLRVRLLTSLTPSKVDHQSTIETRCVKDFATATSTLALLVR